MLLKFAFQDFLDDRRFKNTTKTNIRNYQTLLGEFVDYCISNDVVNVEDIHYSLKNSFFTNVRKKETKREL